MNSCCRKPFNFWPLLILCNLAALSLIYASTHGQVGRFSVVPSQGQGNVGYIAVLQDRQTGKDYPLFDLATKEGQYVGIGTLNEKNEPVVLAELRRVSK